MASGDSLEQFSGDGDDGVGMNKKRATMTKSGRCC